MGSKEFIMARRKSKQKKPARKRDLTICLLRPETDIESIVEGAECGKVECTVGGASATLLYRQRESGVVPWWEEVVDLTDVVNVKLKSQSAGAALVVSVEKQRFAITFGTGRHLIPDNAIVERFGLKTVLNAVDPQKLRVLDHARIDQASRSTHEQVRMPGATWAFSVDTLQDLLSGVAGVPSGGNEWLGSRIVGKDSLTLYSVELSADELPQFLERLLKLERKMDYRYNFAWIDNIKPLRDSRTKSDLEQQLLGALRGEEFDGSIGFGIPSVARWDEIAGFRYSQAKSAPVYQDLALGDFIASLRDLESTTALTLRNRRLWLIDGEGETQSVNSWRCLFAEISMGTGLYILHDGRWYQAKSDFVASINAACLDVPVASLRLPSYCDKREAAYIRRVAASAPGRFVVFDGPENLIHHGGGSSSVEFCDIFDRSASVTRLIHIKRSNRSSGLSHLFSQALVSAEALASDESFRAKVNEKLPRRIRFGKSVDPSSCEIVLGVIERGNRDRPNFPFFSRVSLRNTMRRLRSFGFQVSVLSIEDISPVTEGEPEGEDADD